MLCVCALRIWYPCQTSTSLHQGKEVELMSWSAENPTLLLELFSLPPPNMPTADICLFLCLSREAVSLQKKYYYSLGYAISF